MTGFWFIIYMFTTLFGVSHATLKTKTDGTEERAIVALVFSILMVAIFILTYFAGVYYYITGYAGNPYAFGAYALLTLLSYGSIIFSKWYGFIIVAISIFLLHAIDGLTQFYAPFGG